MVKALQITLGLTFLFQLIRTQLSAVDSNQMKSVVQSTKDEKTGLYGSDYESTYKAVYSLEVLGDNIKDIPKICKELGYESQRTSSRYIVLLDELLKCKNEIVSPSEQPTNVTSLSVFYDSLFLGLRGGLALNYERVYLHLQSYQNKDKLFNPNNIDNPLDGQVSLLYTAYGLKSMALIYNKVAKKYQDYIMEDIKSILSYMNTNHLQYLNSVTIISNK